MINLITLTVEEMAAFSADIVTKAGIRIVVMRRTFVPKILLKKCPNNSETNHKITIRCVGSRIECVSCKAGIEMLCF